MFSLNNCALLLAQSADAWSNTFFGLDPEKRFVLLIIAIGCGTGVIISTVGMIGGIVSSMHRRREQVEFKRDLLDRGMSAEEIARVVESAPPKDFLDRWAASCGKKKTG